MRTEGAGGASCRWSPDVVALGTSHFGAVQASRPYTFLPIAPPPVSVTGAIWPGRESGDTAQSHPPKCGPCMPLGREYKQIKRTHARTYTVLHAPISP